MQTTRTRGTQTYPQSVGNLAVADERLGGLQNPNAKPLSPVRLVIPGLQEEDSEADTLAPATGIIERIILAILPWCLMILIIISRRRDHTELDVTSSDQA